VVELDERQAIIIIPPHIVWHPNGKLENEQFWLQEHRKMVSGYEGLPGHNEPHKLRGSMNTWQEWVRNHTNCLDL